MASSRNRSRIKVGAAVVVATAVALGVGIGTADAGTRRHWWGGQQAKPSVTAKPSPSVTASPSASRSAAATKAPSVTPSASKSASAKPAASQTPTATKTPAATTAPAQGAITLPPANAGFDYQLGGAYTPPAGVTVVSRDSEASAAKGLYNICYINAFQAQPGTDSWWKTNHPDLLLRDKKGNLVIDEVWEELMLDFSTEAKRAALTTIVGGWMDGCATKGFQR